MKDEKVTLDELVAKLDQFGYDFDPYGYMDAVDSREEGFAQIKEELQQGKLSGYREYLQEVRDEGDEFAGEAKEILDLMDRYENQRRLPEQDKQSILARIDELLESKPAMVNAKAVLAKEEAR
jgi:hypothetical protein